VRARWAWVGLVAILAGCGEREATLADACTDPPATVVTALASAPRDVALEGGVKLSECVSRATEAAQLQNVGSILSTAGSALVRRARTDARAAVQLGYLVGAVEKGATGTGGFQDELVFRMRSFLEDGAVRGTNEARTAAGRRAGRAAG
jgi:hypothetical protein